MVDRPKTFDKFMSHFTFRPCFIMEKCNHATTVSLTCLYVAIRNFIGTSYNINKRDMRQITVDDVYFLETNPSKNFADKNSTTLLILYFNTFSYVKGFFSFSYCHLNTFLFWNRRRHVIMIFLFVNTYCPIGDTVKLFNPKFLIERVMILDLKLLVN